MSQFLNNLKIIYVSLSVSIRLKLIFLYVVSLITVVTDFLSIGTLLPVASILVVNTFEDVAGYSVISQLPLINDDNYKIYITLLFVIVLTLSTFMKILQIFVQARVLHGIGQNLSSMLFRQFSEYDLMSRTEVSSSLVVSLMHQRTVDFVREVLIPSVHVPIAVIYLVVVTSLLVLVDPFFAVLAIFSVSAAYGFIGLLSTRILGRAAFVINRNVTLIVKLLQDYYNSSKSVILNNEHEHYVSRQSHLEWALRRAKGNVQIVAAIPKPAIEFLVLVIAVLTLYWYQRNNEFSSSVLPTVAAIVFAFQRTIPILQKGFNGYTLLRGSSKVIEEIALFLTNKRSPRTSVYKKAKNGSALKIVVAGVNYSYGSKKLFSNVDLEIRGGQIIRFTGSSGSGKSTLIDLISGLKNPSSGNIVFLKSDGSQLPSQCLPKISYVGQQIGLLGGTIESNIVLTNHFDQEKFDKALEISCSSELISQFPEGAAHQVNDTSSSISGGQAQRIGLARAIYADCDILVLDEATTGVDKKSEKMIFSSLRNWIGSRIIIVVSHDDAVENYCDDFVNVEEINA